MRLIVVLLFLGFACGCGSSPVKPSEVTPPPVPPPPAEGNLTGPTITAISPTSAVAGSADLTIRVTGTNFVDGFPEEITSWVRWSGNGVRKDLETKFVTDTELKALIPASLLSTPGTAYLLVENGDIISVSDGYDHYPQSNSVEFQVTARTTDRHDVR